uniref:Uncharacterized protein n=1 Tax=Nelumbo nucifera TaxID=4432 RepID=A0A822XXR6_NELNU|nr:TPA_asm: hypothetical protein HUJ06_027892 [Nelumbo nucifera]
MHAQASTTLSRKYSVYLLQQALQTLLYFCPPKSKLHHPSYSRPLLLSSDDAMKMLQTDGFMQTQFDVNSDSVTVSDLNLDDYILDNDPTVIESGPAKPKPVEPRPAAVEESKPEPTLLAVGISIHTLPQSKLGTCFPHQVETTMGGKRAPHEFYPDDWYVEYRCRLTGKYTGRVDTYYYHQKLYYMFRSWRTVKLFLSTGKVRKYEPKKKQTMNNSPDIMRSGCSQINGSTMRRAHKKRNLSSESVAENTIGSVLPGGYGDEESLIIVEEAASVIKALNYLSHCDREESSSKDLKNKIGKGSSEEASKSIHHEGSAIASPSPPS